MHKQKLVDTDAPGPIQVAPKRFRYGLAAGSGRRHPQSPETSRPHDETFESVGYLAQFSMDGRSKSSIDPRVLLK